MTNTNTDPQDDRKAKIEQIEQVQRAKREEAAEKATERKEKRREQAAKAKAWAKKQVAEEEKKEKEAAKKKEQYKERKKQAEKEYAEFRAKKDAEAKRLEEQKEQTKKERQEKLAYLKDISDTNRWHIMNEQKERTAEETKEQMKKDANIEAKRTKLNVITEEKRKKGQLERDYKKEFSKADIFEKDRIEAIRTEARQQQAKLGAKYKTEADVLDGRIARKRTKPREAPTGAAQGGATRTYGAQPTQRQIYQTGNRGRKARQR